MRITDSLQRSRSIRSLALISVAGTILVSLAIGSMTFRTWHASGESREAVAGSIERLELLQRTENIGLLEFSSLSALTSLQDPAIVQLYLNSRRLSDESLDRLINDARNEEERDFALRVQSLHEGLNTIIDESLGLFLRGEVELAIERATRSGIVEATSEITTSFHEPVAEERLELSRLQALDDQRQTQMMIGLAVMAGLLLVFVASLGALLVTWVFRPLRSVGESVEVIASGDLSARVPYLGDTELGRLGEGINRMTESLIETLRAGEYEQARLAALANSIAAGLVMIGADGAVSYNNSQVAEMLNTSAGDLVGLDEAGLQAVLVEHAEDKQRAEATFQQLSGANTAWRSQNIVLRSPSKKVLRCSMFPVLDAGGLALGKGLLLNDVTREHELEQMKDEFIGIASHELRTPLTGIMGFTELLRDGLEPGSLESRWAGRVNNETQRLANLVSDLLDASRIDSGSLELHSEVFSVEDCLNQVIERALSGWPNRHVLIHDSEPVTLEADQSKLIQVATNLLDNALKYSPESESVEISYRNRGRDVELTVTDHGAGIPRDQLEHIFEKFHRLETANPETRGTGLGLYITRSLVDCMGGHLTVKSMEGQGSTFTLTLPLTQLDTQPVAA